MLHAAWLLTAADVAAVVAAAIAFAAIAAIAVSAFVAFGHVFCGSPQCFVVVKCLIYGCMLNIF